MCLEKIKSKTHQKNTNYKSTEYKARKKETYMAEKYIRSLSKNPPHITNIYAKQRRKERMREKSIKI